MNIKSTNQSLVKDYSRSKLSKIISKRITKSFIGTILHVSLLVSSPFIIYDVIDNINDEYAKKVIVISGSVITIYQIEKSIRSIQMTKYLLDTYSIVEELPDEDFPNK